MSDKRTSLPWEEPGCPQCGDTFDYTLTPPRCVNCGFPYPDPDSTLLPTWDRELTECAQYWDDEQLHRVYTAWVILWAELDLEDQYIDANALHSAFQRLLEDRGLRQQGDR